MLKHVHPMKAGDFILIVLVALISLGALVAIPILLGGTPANGKEIVVNMDGREIHRFTMPEAEEMTLIDFPLVVGGGEYTATLEVLDGAVRLRRLPMEISPLAIHAEMGWIREPFQMIVSLPIRLVITVEYREQPDGLPVIDVMIY